MDKQKTINLALVLLPLIAVVLAGMGNSVTVYAPDTEVVYCSFFTYIEDVELSICMPFAAIFGAVAFGLAVIHLVKKSAIWVKWVLGFAFVSMTLAVLPIMMRTETFLVPNMLVPILMLAECLLAYSMIAKPREEQKQEAKRLKEHK